MRALLRGQAAAPAAASALNPFGDLAVPPFVAALPKADLHLHQEAVPRLDAVLARRERRPPHDWRAAARRVMAEVPPGMARLEAIFAPDDAPPGTGPVGRALDADPELFVARLAHVLAEGAAAGAVLLEVRCGAVEVVSRPDFMALFRAAERRARRHSPRLRAEAIAYLGVRDDAAAMAVEARRFEACLRAARDGLAGIDFRVDPYGTDDPAPWALAATWAHRAADAGLGITVHAGEFSAGNLEPALRLPGVRRIGHGVHAAATPHLLERVARSGVTLECCLSSNVVLGAVASYQTHPIRRLMAHGIPVTLNTDLSMHVCITIDREYAIAAALGFSPAELVTFTRTAVEASFTTPQRRAALLREVGGAPRGDNESPD